ncbi:hypothetical protein HYH03_002956 [Edaphochlamys debaryana]|uniref:PNPLA domain-containing protein n=1 Tax=Edaphochlamys debaryana TaxID=47281 RepID=A0A835YB49_9CHLO|nr:hypothetical protein HYH03_002956 [Edaphochlamys debaryana]|eukprot:KAG2499381.1 hypothetical protein HYH03_002956 [Edaphochlamys debaryana]
MRVRGCAAARAPRCSRSLSTLPRALALALALAACLPGACNAAVFDPSDPARVFVWSGSDQPGFVFPELDPEGPWGIPALQARPNIGLALSGGGYRAATLALGWVRALHVLGVLPHLRYIASNSGGSWFNGALSYGGYPVGAFLGPYAPPAALNRDALASPSLLPGGSWGDTLAAKSIIADAVKGVLADLFTPGRDSFSGWTSAITGAFLDPYGLGLQNSSITALGTRGEVATRLAAAYPGVPLYAAMATPDRAYPIVMGSILRAETARMFYPFEITPLYTGAPARNTTVDPPIGAGFLEPLGFNSPPPDKPPTAAPPVGLQGAVNVTPERLVPLGTYLGISSSFVVQGVRPTSTAGFALTGTERLQYWNTRNYTGARLSFADGAGADNLAVTPLLRRRVQHVIACVAASHSADVSPADWAVAQYDVAGLFGAVPLNATQYEGLKEGITGVQPGVYNQALQVFPREGYDELYAALAGSLKNGQAALHRAAYPVLDNPGQGIIGGWTVDVLWLVNMRADQWEAQLPNDTRAFLNKSRDTEDRQARSVGAPRGAVGRGSGGTRSAGDLQHYPYISTFTANYSPELVTLLSQQGAWSMLQAADELRDMLVLSGSSAGAAGDASSITSASSPPPSSPNATANGTAGGPNATMTQPLPASAAALQAFVLQPPDLQLAGSLPPGTQERSTPASNATAGLPEAARQPANSYVMDMRGEGGGPAKVMGPDTGGALAATAAATPAGSGGGAEERGGGVGGRAAAWARGLLATAAVQVRSGLASRQKPLASSAGAAPRRETGADAATGSCAAHAARGSAEAPPAPAPASGTRGMDAVSSSSSVDAQLTAGAKGANSSGGGGFPGEGSGSGAATLGHGEPGASLRSLRSLLPPPATRTLGLLPQPPSAAVRPVPDLHGSAPSFSSSLSSFTPPPPSSSSCGDGACDSAGAQPTPSDRPSPTAPTTSPPPVDAARAALDAHLAQHRATSEARRRRWASVGGAANSSDPSANDADGGAAAATDAGPEVAAAAGERWRPSRPPGLVSALSGVRGAASGLLLPRGSRPPADLGQRYRLVLGDARPTATDLEAVEAGAPSAAVPAPPPEGDVAPPGVASSRQAAATAAPPALPSGSAPASPLPPPPPSALPAPPAMQPSSHRPAAYPPPASTTPTSTSSSVPSSSPNPPSDRAASPRSSLLRAGASWASKRLFNGLRRTFLPAAPPPPPPSNPLQQLLAGAGGAVDPRDPADAAADNEAALALGRAIVAGLNRRQEERERLAVGGGSPDAAAAGLAAAEAAADVSAAAAAGGAARGGATGCGGHVHTSQQAAETMAALAEGAAAQRAAAEALEEWVGEHPLAHVALALALWRLQAELIHTQLALWRPVELLNGRLALIGLLAGMTNELTNGHTLAAQAAERPLAVPSAFALLLLLTAAQRQMAPHVRWRTRGLLTSPVAHRWLGRAAMVGIVWAAVAEATDPAHRPVVAQLREAVLGSELWARVQGPATAAAAAAARRGEQSALLEWLWVMW